MKTEEQPVKMNSDKPPTTLGLNTKVTFSLLVVLASPLMGLIAIYFKMDAIQRDIRKSWTIPHQAIWADRFASKNPGIIVPNVSDVVNTIDASSKSSAP